MLLRELSNMKIFEIEKKNQHYIRKNIYKKKERKRMDHVDKNVRQMVHQLVGLIGRQY